MTMDLNAIGARHTAWVAAMGWHNKTVLESLALIASEIGEAAAECLVVVDTARFGEELADIVLRCVDLAQTEGIDLNVEVSWVTVRWKTVTAAEGVAELLVDYALWSNTARKAVLGTDFARGMATVVARVISLADRFGIDLNQEVARKLAKNAERGTRGRPI